LSNGVISEHIVITIGNMKPFANPVKNLPTITEVSVLSQAKAMTKTKNAYIETINDGFLPYLSEK